MKATRVPWYLGTCYVRPERTVVPAPPAGTRPTSPGPAGSVPGGPQRARSPRQSPCGLDAGHTSVRMNRIAAGARQSAPWRGPRTPSAPTGRGVRKEVLQPYVCNGTRESDGVRPQRPHRPDRHPGRAPSDARREVVSGWIRPCRTPALPARPALAPAGRARQPASTPPPAAGGPRWRHERSVGRRGRSGPARAGHRRADRARGWSRQAVRFPRTGCSPRIGARGPCQPGPGPSAPETAVRRGRTSVVLPHTALAADRTGPRASAGTVTGPPTRGRGPRRRRRCPRSCPRSQRAGRRARPRTRSRPRGPSARPP